MVARGVPAEAVMAVAALNFTESSNWWRDINDSPFWQDRSTSSNTIESAGIWLDHAEVRCFVFVFRRDVQKLQPEIVQHILLDMPALLSLQLMRFWSCSGLRFIIRQARAVSTDGLRPSFYTINAVVYVGVQELEFYSVNQYSQAARKVLLQLSRWVIPPRPILRRIFATQLFWLYLFLVGAPRSTEGIALSDLTKLYFMIISYQTKMGDFAGGYQHSCGLCSHGSLLRSKLEIAIGKELLNGRFTGSTVEYNGEAGG
ncbi:hypothetical protein SESBI_07663 [Sesbania bispinosa]|nr:hypothetical protein SESBI_07663 [Sesbania bispinosa]